MLGITVSLGLKKTMCVCAFFLGQLPSEKQGVHIRPMVSGGVLGEGRFLNGKG